MENSRRKERFECEILCSHHRQEAAESAQKWEECVKNPGHASFIPARKFSLQHLPERFRTDAVLEFVRLTCAISVRLRVNHTSVHRPTDNGFYDVNKDGGIGAAGGGRLGTGTIVAVEKNVGFCSCQTCSSRHEPRMVWWSLCVVTARHVLYDDDEAKLATVDLYFDDEESRRSDGRMRSLEGVQVLGTDSRNDFCSFLCVTHDEALAEEVKSHLVRWEWLYRTMVREEKKSVSGADDQEKVVVVSHPHGRPKHVTVGDLKEWPWCGNDVRVNAAQHSYSADTCPGSSGAAVFILGRGVSKPFLPVHAFLHCLGGEQEPWNKGYTILVM